MHGKISLESSLSAGTTAIFSIPFNKPQFQGAGAPLVDASALPDRLQADLSLPCTTSSNKQACVTPPITSPMGRPIKSEVEQQMNAINSAMEKTTSPLASPAKARELDRSKIQVLVVEDKSVSSFGEYYLS